jgi:hypothetical protein
MASPLNTLSVTMPVTEVFLCRADSDWVCCLNCGASLNLVQPKTEEPQRLVGTCDQCGCWYLLDWLPGTAEGLMLLLPNLGETLTAFRCKDQSPM